MQRHRYLALAAAFALAISAVVAGGDHYKCTASTQECLDKMVASLKDRGWVGLELDKDEETSGYLVTRVVPDSPAVKAGFKKGDVLLAMNGIGFGEENQEALKKAKMEQSPGKEVTYTISRKGYKRDLLVTLAPVPTEVLAQWVGGHMIEHATAEIAQKD